VTGRICTPLPLWMGEFSLAALPPELNFWVPKGTPDWRGAL